MKKYKQKVPIISPLRIAVAALCVAAASAVIIHLLGKESGWAIICTGVSGALLIFAIFIWLGASGKYQYCHEFVELSWLSFCYKKIKYSSFDTIVISNASYNNGYGRGINSEIPMEYRIARRPCRCDAGEMRGVLPYITFITSRYPINSIRTGMSSRDLFLLNDRETYSLGVCWFCSLQELLECTSCPVCVLEDVYLRFKDMFDTVFLEDVEKIDRVYIIAEQQIAYQRYWQEQSN